MNKLNELIARKAWELDALMAYRNILQTHCCNECAKRGYCQKEPAPGQMVRYNCYDYVGGEAE